MGLTVKIDSVEKDIEAMVRNDLSREAQGKAIADYVRAGIAEADDTNRRILGRLPPKTITVDGSEGAALESVNPDGGSIIIEWEIVTDVLIWIAQTLIERSPTVSGAYKKSHTLLADGQEVRIGSDIPPADEYTFINLVPYARRVEIGTTKSGRAFLIQVPNRIYERTAKDASARFGNIADIKFGYREAANAYTLKHSAGRRKDRARGSAVSSPAIIVKLRKS